MREVFPEPRIRLDELDKEEWQDIAMQAKEGLTQEDYDEMWEQFQVYKRLGRVN